MSNIAVSTLIYREHNLESALSKIKNAGFSKIDLSIILPSFCPHYDPINTSLEDDLRLKSLLEGYQVSVSSLNVVPGYYNKDRKEDIDFFIKRCIDIAVIINAPIITIPSGAKCDLEKWTDNVLQVKKCLLEINKYAVEHKITLSIETPHINTLTETLEQCVQFYNIINEPAIKCTLDTSHVKRLISLQPAIVVEKIGIEKINHIHLRDSYHEEIDFTPGKGQVDFISLIDVLRDKYTGIYSLELEYDNITEYQKETELLFAKKYIEGILIKGRLSIRQKLLTIPFLQFILRFVQNPKAEIKRHKSVLRKIKKVKPYIQPYLPQKVYIGRWSKKIRWNNNRIVSHKPGSVLVSEKGIRNLRVGIIGCGWAGMEMHARGFQRLTGVELVGGFDIEKSKCDVFSKRYNTSPCYSLTDLVQDRKPDIISVCTREWLHYDHVMLALNNGVNVFCEKILATRYLQAEEMVKTANDNKLILGVNYNYRYMPGIKKLHELIQQKALGHLSFININVHAFSYAHALDLLTFLGGKISEVSANINNDNRIRNFAGTDWSVYDKEILYIPSICTSLTVRFENGTIGIVNSSFFYNLHKFVLEIEAVFESGVVNLNGINMFNTRGNLTYSIDNKIRKVNMDYKKKVYARGYEYTFYESIKDFVEKLTLNEPAPISGEDGLFNLYLEKKIFEADFKKQRIRLTDINN